MTEYDVQFSGTGIVDKHTHYEAYPYVGPERATIIIRGDIAEGFQKKFGIPMREAERLNARVDLGRNDEKVRECQDVYKHGSYLMGAIHSLDDIVYAKSK